MPCRPCIAESQSQPPKSPIEARRDRNTGELKKAGCTGIHEHASVETVKGTVSEFPVWFYVIGFVPGACSALVGIVYLAGTTILHGQYLFTAYGIS